MAKPEPRGGRIADSRWFKEGALNGEKGGGINAESACVRRCKCLCVKAKQIVAVAEAVQQQQPCGPLARRLAGKIAVSLCGLRLSIHSLAPAAPSSVAHFLLGQRWWELKTSHFWNFCCCSSSEYYDVPAERFFFDRSEVWVFCWGFFWQMCYL